MNTDYVATMQAQLEKWDADVAELGAERDRQGIDARAPYHEGIMDLRARRDTAEKAWKKIRGATDWSGGHLQDVMDTAWKAMQATLLRVTAQVHK